MVVFVCFVSKEEAVQSKRKEQSPNSKILAALDRLYLPHSPIILRSVIFSTWHLNLQGVGQTQVHSLPLWDTF